MSRGRGRSLRERLSDEEILLLPGAANALAARVIEETGYEAVYVTGAGVANTFLGVPDLGLLSLKELADHVVAISDAVALPVVVDADTGFGNAVNAYRTVRVLEKAGASGIQLEDQVFPKRCGHFEGKEVIPQAEMVEKIHAALDARTSDETLIIARTDARSVLGFDNAVERANAYRDAGADVIFLEAPVSKEEVASIPRLVPGPHLSNMVIGGKTPLASLVELRDQGYSIALFANLALQASVAAMSTVLADLREEGDIQSSSTAIASFADRQRLVKKGEYDDLSQKYSIDSKVEV